MIWVVEMQNGGVFEAETKRKFINQMIKYYAENDRAAGQIKAIYYITKNDKTDELCSKAVSKIQNIVEEGLAEYRAVIVQENTGWKQIESEIKDEIYG